MNQTSNANFQISKLNCGLHSQKRKCIILPIYSLYIGTQYTKFHIMVCGETLIILKYKLLKCRINISVYFFGGQKLNTYISSYVNMISKSTNLTST